MGEVKSYSDRIRNNQEAKSSNWVIYKKRNKKKKLLILQRESK